MLTNFVFDLVAGTSSTTKQLRRRVLQLANYKFNILLSGPAGSGKQLLAQAIHRHSDRQDRPFIPVDCKALSGPFFSSQMFGIGSSNSLLGGSIGCYRCADGGTLFLKHVDALTLGEQLELVTALKETQSDVRVMASSIRDLDGEVRAGRFRSDLYQLISTTTVECPALVEHPEDIRPLVAFFLAKSSIEYGVDQPQISNPALAVLESYDWPNNVRELEETIDIAVQNVEASDAVIGLDSFDRIAELLADSSSEYGNDDERDETTEAVNSQESVSNKPLTPTDEWPTLAAAELAHIRKTLEQADYNARVAAKMLGLTFRGFQQKLTQHRLHGFLRAKASRRDAV
ncbi:MAG: sigma-54-dependent Fis family transcriptional regulator [Planctomycetales bacterium]|nr:sigma-54-dependent Fis family transcriptional regulator [Planctomycetales bacterium]